jgi:hypothetical protein
MCGFLFVHFERVVSCFGAPASIVIPSTVREIGPKAFYRVSTIRDLNFEEGVLCIGVKAFSFCRWLGNAAFPASLEVIESCAFNGCSSLATVTFAVGPRLRRIGKRAFLKCPLRNLVLPASINELDPSAFDDGVWPNVAWTGRWFLLVRNDFLFSADSHILLHSASEDWTIMLPAQTEVIGRRAFRRAKLCSITFSGFESGTRLREIAEKAFSRCGGLKSFTVPASVETIGDRCFEHCSRMTKVRFAEVSMLKKIGTRAFFNCRLSSIRIPASVEEIDGSAFAGCPLLVIEVAAGSRNFMIEKYLLTTADGTKIVRFSLAENGRL